MAILVSSQLNQKKLKANPEEREREREREEKLDVTLMWLQLYGQERGTTGQALNTEKWSYMI